MTPELLHVPKVELWWNMVPEQAEEQMIHEAGGFWTQLHEDLVTPSGDGGLDGA